VEILELHLEVVSQVPVQTHRYLAQLATVNRIVVQIEIGVAGGEFPGPDAEVPAPVLRANGPERSVDAGNVVAGQSAQATIIGTVFTRQEVADGDIASPVIQISNVPGSDLRIGNLGKSDF